MNQSKIKSYRDLTVWQRAKAFAVQIYKVTDEFPRKEQYSLTDQIRVVSLIYVYSATTTISCAFERQVRQCHRYI